MGPCSIRGPAFEHLGVNVYVFKHGYCYAEVIFVSILTGVRGDIRISCINATLCWHLDSLGCIREGLAEHL